VPSKLGCGTEENLRWSALSSLSKIESDLMEESMSDLREKDSLTQDSHLISRI